MGGSYQLNQKEQAVNDIILTIKDDELDLGFNDSSKFLASHHFFHVKQRIELSRVFSVLQMMPKGALLHGHNTAMVSSDWVIRNVTYRPGVIMYTTEENVVKFSFRKPAKYHWNYVADLRKAAPNVSAFDKQLESYLNLYTPQPEVEYPDIDVVWGKFQTIFDTIKDLVSYYPVYIDFHYQLLKELLDDNIMYAEIRMGCGPLYCDDDRTYNSIEAVQIMKDIVTDFRMRNPKFFGAKVIFTSSRNADPNSFEDVNRFRELR